MPTDGRLDIILFGATGFTGQLVAERLSQIAATKPLRWAVAGRNAPRLHEIVAGLGRSPGNVPEVLVADSADRASLDAMVARARVIISTVGPYARYGSELVAACAEAGVSYCDLTGEAQWIRRMIDAHHERAVATGARIVHCCGFDSVPSDIGTHVLQSRAIAVFGSPCERVDFVLRHAAGGFSGGTAASVMNVLREASGNRDLRRMLADPYSLNPADARGEGDSRNDFPVDHIAPLNGWGGPFLMAPINTRVVRRSNALLGFRYGRTFKYREMAWFGRGPLGRAKAESARVAYGSFVALASAEVARKGLERWVLPAPGQGPSREQIEKGSFVIDLIGYHASGSVVRTTVRGRRDPGYGATASMLSACAMTLAFDEPANAQRGVLTPAVALGDNLVARLAPLGVTFETVP